MTTKTTADQRTSVVEQLAELRDQYAADANRLAAALGNGPSLDDLARVEADLRAQLADVHRRRAERAALESEHRAFAEAAEFFAGLVDRTRRRAALSTLPRPDHDPLAGLPGLVDDSREQAAAEAGESGQ